MEFRMTQPPDNPAGEFEPVDAFDAVLKAELIEVIRAAPTRLREAVLGLSEDTLDTRYRNWTIRQIVHHIADSHIHSYVRFKWTVAEDHPTIKPYAEGDWAVLTDSVTGPVEPSLSLVEGLHGRWTGLLDAMSDDDFGRTFFHPESNEDVSLWHALQYYAWHGRHHTAQIEWLLE